MKKRLLMILALILCLACLFACTTEEVVVPDDDGKQSESESNSDSESESDTESQTESESEFVTESESESESATESESESQTESESESESESATESETKVEPEGPIAGVTQTTDVLVAKNYPLSANPELFRFIGRSKQVKEGTICDHSASGIEFQGYFTGDVNLTVESNNQDTYYTVYIDGKRVEERFCAKAWQETTLKLATFEGKYFHTVKILKQSEIGWTTSTLLELDVTGFLVDAPEDRKLYFEFYGDSLTSAFGNVGTPYENQPYDIPKWQDATQSYGFLMSEFAEADCSILAMSGVGLSVGYYDNPFLDYFSKYSHKRGDEEFSFEGARVPDIAFIHLGANDESVGDNPNNIRGFGENTGSFKTNFKAKAKEFINYIRSGYKTDVPIVWAYDPWEGVPNYIQEVLDELGGEEAGLYTIGLEWHGISGYTGAGSHPSVKAHEAHSYELLELILEKNILE